MITIRKATINDVEAIVKIHEQAFPDFFLTTLGKRFLCLYYKCMCDSKDAITLCAMDEGQIVGFSSTALKSVGFNTRLVKHNMMSFALEAMKLLFTSPNSLVRLVNNFTKKSSEVEDNGDYAELFSIGVSPFCQGKGVGSLLLSNNEHMIRGGGEKAVANNG